MADGFTEAEDDFWMTTNGDDFTRDLDVTIAMCESSFEEEYMNLE